MAQRHNGKFYNVVGNSRDHSLQRDRSIHMIFSYICGMECRENCAACCIALSISSQIPGMPAGKPAGVRCIHLLDDYKCDIYTSPYKPKVCDDFKAELQFCGTNREEAMKILSSLS